MRAIVVNTSEAEVESVTIKVETIRFSMLLKDWVDIKEQGRMLKRVEEAYIKSYLDCQRFFLIAREGEAGVRVDKSVFDSLGWPWDGKRSLRAMVDEIEESGEAELVVVERSPWRVELYRDFDRLEDMVVCRRRLGVGIVPKQEEV